MISKSERKISDKEIIEMIMENPELRRKIIEAIQEDVEDALNVTLVNAIKRGTEKPSKWWEWLFLIIVGALAGGGLATAIIYHQMMTSGLP